jgi:hypothetical protein
MNIVDIVKTYLGTKTFGRSRKLSESGYFSYFSGTKGMLVEKQKVYLSPG